MKKRIFSIVLAGILTGSISAMGVSAEFDGSLGAFGTEQTVTEDNAVENPVIKVVVPTSFDFAVDAFEQKDNGSQIYSSENYIINKSNVAIKADIAMSVKSKGSGDDVIAFSETKEGVATAVASNADAKSMWLAAIAATGIQEAKTETANVADQIGLYMYFKLNTKEAISDNWFKAFDANKPIDTTLGEIVYSSLPSIDPLQETPTAKTGIGSIAGAKNVYGYNSASDKLTAAAAATDIKFYSGVDKVAAGTAVDAETLTSADGVNGFLEITTAAVYKYAQKIADSTYAVAAELSGANKADYTAFYSTQPIFEGITGVAETTFNNTISAKGIYDLTSDDTKKNVFTLPDATTDGNADTTMSFALGKANALNVNITPDLSKSIPTTINSDADTKVGAVTLKESDTNNKDQGIAAFRFIGNVNDSIVWDTNMAEITVKYKLTGLSDDTYGKALTKADPADAAKFTLNTNAHQLINGAAAAAVAEDPEITTTTKPTSNASAVFKIANLGTLTVDSTKTSVIKTGMTSTVAGAYMTISGADTNGDVTITVLAGANSYYSNSYKLKVVLSDNSTIEIDVTGTDAGTSTYNAAP